MASGRIVVLNGTSSSGKSSTAAALQALLRETGRIYYRLQADLLRDMHPDRLRSREVAMPTLLQAIPDFAAALASHGNDVILDDCFGPLQLKNYVHSLASFEVYYVGVRCNRGELLRRERERSDRPGGAALGLARTVYLPGIFDLEVDTSLATSEECAKSIVARLDAGDPPSAFHRLTALDLDAIIEQASVKWTTIEIVNSASNTVHVSQIDHLDQRQPQHELNPGETYVQKISNVHDWEVRDHDGGLMTTFRSEGSPQRLII